MFLRGKQLLLFWLTFISLYYSQFNTKAEPDFAPVRQTESTPEDSATIAMQGSPKIYLPLHKAYGDAKENNEATRRKVFSKILPVKSGVTTLTTNFENSFTDLSQDLVRESGSLNVTVIPQKLHSFKNSKSSEKIILDNFNWEFKKNVKRLFADSAQKRNRKNLTAGSFMESHAPSLNDGMSDSVENQNVPSRRHIVPEKLQYTREITIKQGRLVGIVRSFQSLSGLRDVDQYLGLPYAEAPTGSRRFMPPGTPLPWSGLKIARHLPPVCLQKLPEISLQNNTKLTRGRLRYLSRLMPYLKNESEDCLYLNVFVPKEGASQRAQLYPVIVYLHGESFEWNSGNAYDGSVLASYGEVMVVTVNFRLGLMGFLKPGISDSTISNFGILDQIAALHWITENIIAFGGDKDKVTLMGHGTGAACVNYLMISPVAAGLFHRAVLMSGSAMSDWASSNHSLEITMKIAHTLECPMNDDNEEMISCLRQKSYQELSKVPINMPQFSIALGPIVDGHVIPDQPYKAMGQYTELFSRYDLLFGLTESEAYHALTSSALEEGLSENERDSYLRFFLQSRFDVRPDLAMAATLKKYNDMYNHPNRATNVEHRDVVLDILSDARIVGPLMQTGLFHSEVNRYNYMYVFGHNTAAGPYSNLPHSISGEELAFLFGAPLSPSGIFHGNTYTVQEKLLSEAVMMYWTNFAKTGNPKAPWRGTFLNLHATEWERYDLDWPEFNKRNQAFLNIGIPPSIGYKYRQIYMNFWNKELPDELNQIADIQQQPFIYGKYIPVSSTTHSVQNYPTRRPTDEVITGHLNKYGNRDYGSEDPVRTLKLLMQETGRAVPMSSDVEVENVYNVPPTLRKGKQSDKNVFGVQTVSNIMNTYGSDGKEETNSHGVENTVSRNNANEINSVEGSAISKMSTVTESSTEEVAKSESTLKLLVGLIVVFITLNVIIYSTFLLQKRRKKQARTLGIQRNLKGILSYDGTTDDELKRSKQHTQNDGDESFILDVVRKSNTYEPVRTMERSPINGYKISRELSSSTVDTHTKVSEWICAASRGGGGMGGTLMRFPRESKKSESSEFSTLRGNSADGLVSALSFSMSPKQVSVAIDATPQARSNSVLCQEPIELTKLKAEGGKIIICEDIEVSDHELLTPQLSLDAADCMLMANNAMIDITLSRHPYQFHQYSNSDPIDIYYSNLSFDEEKITSFMDDVDKFSDINVTCLNETTQKPFDPLTPEQQLLAIKRRNYPKVLPTKRKDGDFRETDSPPMTLDLSTSLYKRNSLPPNSLLPMLGNKQIPPPVPPPRTISTLGRKPMKEQRRKSQDITTSPLSLARISAFEENEPEPQIAENTLIVGPIVPKCKTPSNNEIKEIKDIFLTQNKISATKDSEEKTHVGTDLFHAFAHHIGDDIHTTEKIYSIEAALETPITPTSPSSFSIVNSAVTTPSTIPAKSLLYFTPTVEDMIGTGDNYLHNVKRNSKEISDCSNEGATCQAGRQELKKCKATKPNIPLRGVKHVLAGSELSEENHLNASFHEAEKMQNAHCNTNCNKIQPFEEPENMTQHKKSQLNLPSEIDISKETKPTSALLSNNNLNIQHGNIKNRLTQSVLSSDETQIATTPIKRLTTHRPPAKSANISQQSSQQLNISHLQQDHKSTAGASTKSIVSSNDSASQRSTTLCSDSNSSSSSSTNTVRTDLKKK